MIAPIHRKAKYPTPQSTLEGMISFYNTKKTLGIKTIDHALKYGVFIHYKTIANARQALAEYLKNLGDLKTAQEIKKINRIRQPKEEIKNKKRYFITELQRKFYAGEDISIENNRPFMEKAKDYFKTYKNLFEAADIDYEYAKGKDFHSRLIKDLKRYLNKKPPEKISEVLLITNLITKELSLTPPTDKEKLTEKTNLAFEILDQLRSYAAPIIFSKNISPRQLELLCQQNHTPLKKTLDTIINLEYTIFQANIGILNKLLDQNDYRTDPLLSERFRDEGKEISMRTIRGYNSSRKTKFSTYMALSIKKRFRTVKKEYMEKDCKTISLNKGISKKTGNKKNSREYMELFVYKFPSQLDLAMDADLKQAVKETLSILEKRERSIIERYFGLNNNEPESLKHIGNDLGLTKERIRQIKYKAIKKLKKRVISEKIKDYAA